ILLSRVGRPCQISSRNLVLREEIGASTRPGQGCVENQIEGLSTSTQVGAGGKRDDYVAHSRVIELKSWESIIRPNERRGKGKSYSRREAETRSQRPRGLQRTKIVEVKRRGLRSIDGGVIENDRVSPQLTARPVIHVRDHADRDGICICRKTCQSNHARG